VLQIRSRRKDEKIDQATVTVFTGPVQVTGMGIRKDSMKKTFIPLLFLLLTACVSGQYVVSKLYFGLSGPGGSRITNEEFRDFVDSAVTPLFPDGLTIYAAEGQWKDSAKAILKEQSMVVEIVHQGRRNDNNKFSAIVDRYKKRFRQESVMLVQSRSKVEF